MRITADHIVVVEVQTEQIKNTTEPNKKQNKNIHKATTKITIKATTKEERIRKEKREQE